MKRLFEDEISLDDIKKLLKKLKRKNELSNFIIAILGCLLVAAAVAFVVYKLFGRCCNDDCLCDEDCEDDYQADDDDFEDE